MAPLETFDGSRDTRAKTAAAAIPSTAATATSGAGTRGSWQHGVTVFAGGAPHDMRPPFDTVVNSGTVLFTSETLRPDLSSVPLTKPGWPGERVGRSGSQPHRHARSHSADAASAAAAAAAAAPDRGTVLGEWPHLQPAAADAGMNVVGGRPTERRGARGSFTPGSRILAGGPARASLPLLPPPEGDDADDDDDVPDRGRVLSSCERLTPDLSGAARCKPGTRGEERWGRVGSFEGGATRLRMPSAADAARWREDDGGAHKGVGRRFGPAHYLAGTTVLSGGAPTYKAKP
ncbi:hypothetical protein JKP88DRAFT_311261 [Tribonema minus]|uniref:Uncharacterized protein n=1 Tax=Tribonema minus TaxID=303371 RepID=A0A836CJG1_9STRA|nr:hypothetical protein JKP88DRAFT_311261 [Tribonema minus]